MQNRNFKKDKTLRLKTIIKHTIMKRTILLAIIFCYSSVYAQTTESAFSKSYSFEYETQYAKAIAALTDLHIDSYQINLRLGWLYYLSKDYVKAESCYRKAVTAEPSSIEARFGLVLPLSTVGNWNSVLAVYLEIVKLDPNNSIANYRIASIYFARKDYTNAKTYVSKVLKLYPFDYDSNLLSGKILIAQTKNADAKKYIIKALEYNPQSEEAKAILKKL
jgi:tetratricopeptide (TPR) repeat protein